MSIVFTLSWLQAEEEGIVPLSDGIREISACGQIPGIVRAFPDTVIGDVIFEMDVQTPTGDFQLLGVEFDGTYFYVTGANAGAHPNKVYVIDTLGNLIMALDQPDLPDYWGWRDLAWDGVYAGTDGIDTLYGSYGTMVHKFGIRFTDSTLVHYGSFQGPAYPLNRALAYMEDSVWFFTSSGENPGYDYKFSKTDVRLDSCLNNWFMYGAAYDSDVSYGGYVWWHSQDSAGTPFYCLIEQMDALCMDFTGMVFDYVPSTITSGIAGGLCFYEGFRGMDVLFALVQGDPVDVIVGVFLRYHQTGIAEGYDGINLAPENAVSIWPIPSNGQVAISYSIIKPGNASLRIYDKNGCLVRTLKYEDHDAGAKRVGWDGRDADGRAVPSGVYFAELVTQNRREASKIIILR
jgi:hypothetical protein